MRRVRVKPLKRNIEPISIRGCRLTKRRILAIRRLIGKSPDFGRTAISLQLCKKFDFKQQNGWPKDRAMRDILRRLDALNLIRLPESRKLEQNPKIYAAQLLQAPIDRTPISKVSWDQLTLKHAKERDQCRTWDYLVDAHHYLGRKTIVGRNLRQLIYAGDRPVACLGWCDPSLKLAPRDGYLTANFSNGWANVAHGVNNTRFLILPWVKVPNLASKALAVAKRDVRRYWQEYYSLELAWAETFVDPTRFIGTCYLAANWKKVGQTAGTARSGFSALREEHGIAKDIFVYVFREAVERAH